MKRYNTILILFFFAATVFGQNWTSEELNSANTAKDCPYLNQVERDVILYNNLARMYPRKFAQVELRGQVETGYVASLRQDLNNLAPAQPLYVHRSETESAKCWATESGRRGIVGHERVGCSSSHASSSWGENCSYGANSGREIILQLLIDEGIVNLGHRRNCLNPGFMSVGVGFASHSVYTCCCVMDFVVVPGEDYSSHQVIAQSTPAHRTTSAPDSDSSPAVIVATPTTTTTPETTTRRVTPTTTTTPEKKKSGYLQRYFDHSGRSMLSYLSVGYNYSAIERRHALELAVMDFRATLFGASLLNAEFSVSPFNRRFAYKPEIRIYIPATKEMAAVLYGGPEVDASYLAHKLVKTYSYNLYSDFYVNAVFGVAFNFSAVASFPLEVKAEYRRRILPGTVDPAQYSGFYFGVKLYMGQAFKREKY